MEGASYHVETERAQQEYRDDELISYYRSVAANGGGHCDHSSFFWFHSDYGPYEKKQAKWENLGRAVGAVAREGKDPAKPEQDHDWQPGLQRVFS